MSESKLESSGGDGEGRPLEDLFGFTPSCLLSWAQGLLLFLSIYYVPSPQRGVMGEKNSQWHGPCLHITGNQSS